MKHQCLTLFQIKWKVFCFALHWTIFSSESYEVNALFLSQKCKHQLLSVPSQFIQLKNIALACIVCLCLWNAKHLTNLSNQLDFLLVDIYGCFNRVNIVICMFCNMLTICTVCQSNDTLLLVHFWSNFRIEVKQRNFEDLMYDLQSLKEKNERLKDRVRDGVFCCILERHSGTVTWLVDSL